MILEESKLELFRDAIAHAIEADPAFAGVPVLTHRKGDLAGRIDRAIAELGLCVVVTLQGARESGAQTKRIDWKPVRVAVDIAENVLIHASEGDVPGAWAYAEYAVALLKLAHLPAALIEIAREDIEEINPNPDQNPDLLIVRIPVTSRIEGHARTSA